MRSMSSFLVKKTQFCNFITKKKEDNKKATKIVALCFYMFI